MFQRTLVFRSHMSNPYCRKLHQCIAGSVSHVRWSAALTSQQAKCLDMATTDRVLELVIPYYLRILLETLSQQRPELWVLILRITPAEGQIELRQSSYIVLDSGPSTANAIEREPLDISTEVDQGER